MRLLFVQKNLPHTTLEDESFVLLMNHFPNAKLLSLVGKRSIWSIHSFLHAHPIDIVITQKWLPIFTEKPIWTFQLPPRFYPSQRNMSIIQHVQSKTNSSLFLPPLVANTKIPTMGDAIVSYGDFDSSSMQHMVLDAYTLLPKRIKKKHPLILIGNCLDKDYLDRIHIHSYQVDATIISPPKTDILDQARFVVRMGKDINNSPFDRKIIESRRIVLYSEHSNQRWIYPHGIACSPESIDDITQKMKSMLSTVIPLCEPDSHERLSRYKIELQKTWSKHMRIS